MNLRNRLVILTTMLAGLLHFNASAQTNKIAVKTFCNPLNLPYNFQSDGSITRREAADPTIVLYKNKYWLFASKQKGYWFSDDMLNWQ
jgi:xylan 1,4-beta-xylosidase